MIEILARPYRGRWIAGVCAAIENAYGVPLWLVRMTAIVAFFAAPVVLLVYLLLAISIPSERGSADSLVLRNPEFGPRGFAAASTLLLDRTAARLRSVSTRQRTIVPALFLLTLFFGLPKLEGAMFDQIHPMLDASFTSANRVAAAAVYLLIGCTFVFRSRSERQRVAMEIAPRDRFALEATEFKAIGGVAIAISRMTYLDVGVIRVMLLLLNFLTLGIIGALYFLVVWLMRRRIYAGEDRLDSNTSDTTVTGIDNFSVMMAAIFILLAIVRLATEFRWFFFNESFVRGLLLVVAGILLSRRTAALATVGGAVLLFLGVHDIAIALFHVQPEAASRWIINYCLLALAIAYYAFIALRGQSRIVGFGLALVPVVAALLIMAHVVSEPFLLALSRFYDFFSPLIFSGLALWVAMEA